MLAEAQRKKHCIRFDVLYYAKQQTQFEVENEIGAKEGEYIRKYLPALNTQIPKEKDWSKFDVRPIDVKAILRNL